MNSKIKSKKPIPYGQVVVINELIANPQAVKNLEEGIKKNNPQISEADLQNQVYQLVLRDNYYNRVMDIVAKCYEIDFYEAEEKARFDRIKEDNPTMDENTIKSIVRVNIIRELIYNDLKKELSIDVTDDQVKTTLDQYYQSTGQSIRDYLSNRERFEEVRNTIIDQLISDRLLNAFKPDYQLEEFNKKMAEEAAKNKVPS